MNIVRILITGQEQGPEYCNAIDDHQCNRGSANAVLVGRTVQERYDTSYHLVCKVKEGNDR